MSNENPAPDEPQVDVRALRRTLGAFLTGVTVVTTVDEEGSPWGLTANSFTSVSLNPPLILVCIAEGANSYPAFRDCQSFAVNILAEGQDELSLLFASKRPDKFSGIAADARSTGAPILVDSLAWLECSVHDKVVAGDHLVLIGRVEAFDSGTGRPLGYYQGNYVTFGLEEVATVRARPDKRVLVGWIAESDGELVLARRSDEAGVQRWSIPMSPLGDREATDDAMQDAAVASLGSNVDVSFLYSVYDVPEENALYLIYRGQLRQPLSETGTGTAQPVRSFRPDEIPWSDIPERHIRSVLGRYLRERAIDRFGVYMGSADDGTVTMLGGSEEAWGDYMRRLSDTEPPQG